MDKLSLEEKEVIKKLYFNSLPGCVISYLKHHEEVALEDLCEFVGKNYSRLRNVSGCKYKGKNIKKVVQGLLSNPVFVNNLNFISLNVSPRQQSFLEEYEAKKMNSFVKHKLKYNIKISLAPELSGSKNAEKILMIENFCAQLNQDAEFRRIFDKPFDKIKVWDSYEDAGIKVGFERLIGLIQGFEITSRYCKKNVVCEVDKRELLEKYHTRKVLKALNNIERRLDKLEALREVFSERAGSS